MYEISAMIYPNLDIENLTLDEAKESYMHDTARGPSHKGD